MERRAAERSAYCRGCDKRIKKGDEMVTGYSWRCRGAYFHFCLECAKEIGELAKTVETKEEHGN